MQNVTKLPLRTPPDVNQCRRYATINPNNRKHNSQCRHYKRIATTHDAPVSALSTSALSALSLSPSALSLSTLFLHSSYASFGALSAVKTSYLQLSQTSNCSQNPRFGCTTCLLLRIKSTASEPDMPQRCITIRLSTYIEWQKHQRTCVRWVEGPKVREQNVP